jgi:hypothetical protein
MMRAGGCTRHRPSVTRQDRRLACRRRPLRHRPLPRRRHRLHPRRPSPPGHQRQRHERHLPPRPRRHVDRSPRPPRPRRNGPRGRALRMAVATRPRPRAARDTVGPTLERVARLDRCASNQRVVDIDPPRPKRKSDAPRTDCCNHANWLVSLPLVGQRAGYLRFPGAVPHRGPREGPGWCARPTDPGEGDRSAYPPTRRRSGG